MSPKHRRTAATSAACIAAVLSLSPLAGADARPAEPAAQLLELARASREAGQLDAALDVYRRALALSPRLPGAALEYAQTLEAVGAYGEALKTYEMVRESRSAAAARLGAMRCAIRLGQPERALSLADTAARADGRDPQAQVGRGVALDLLRRHAEAQAAYRKALALDPQSRAARNNLALSLALAGDPDAAVTLLRDMVSGPGATAQIRQNLALAYGLKGDAAAARDLGARDLPPDVAAANAAFLAGVRAGSTPAR